MIVAANDLGIAVYFDMVAGHMGDLVRSSSPGYPAYLAPPEEYTLRWRNTLRYPAPFNQLSYFHGHGGIGNYFGQEQEVGTLAELDDLKTETPYVREQMTAIWTYWMEQTPVSGFRIDTVKHVDVGMWEYMLPELRTVAADLNRPNHYTFGEIYGADDDYMAEYIGDLNGGPYKMDAAVDFQFFYTSNGVFARADRPPTDMVGRLNARAQRLAEHHLKMPNFIDNHDVPRFLDVARGNPGAGAAERQRRLELALTFLLTAPGPPVIYYGTEQGFDGGSDPYNREDMWDGQFEQGPSLGDNFDESAPLFRLTKRLTELRNSLRPLRRGTMQTLAARSAGPGEYAFVRRDETDAVLVVLNTSTAARSVGALTVPEFASKTIVDALNPSDLIVVGADGVIAGRTLGVQDAEVWITSDQLPPQLPEVASFAPANAEAAVPITLERITIHFLLPMSKAETEAAVTVSPSVVYTSEWNEAGTELSFLLMDSLAARTTYTVSVAVTAQAESGEHLAFPATATWVTGRGPLVLPEAPPLLGSVEPITAPVVVDGNLTDWPALNTSVRNIATFPSAGGMAWIDALGDDTGDGTYTYPSDAAFSGQEADLDIVRFAHTEQDILIAISPRSINPDASFFTPYFGIAIDTAEGGRTLPIGVTLGSNTRGISELAVRSDFAPEFEIIYTGPIGGRLVRSDDVVEALEAAHSTTTGAVEIRIPRSLLGLTEPLARREIGLVVYTGLETFGGMREVITTRTQWEPGGGITEVPDPDVFDLVGTNALQQPSELAGYDQQEGATILYSILRINLGGGGTIPGSMWSIY
jgi:glycosidase